MSKIKIYQIILKDKETGQEIYREYTKNSFYDWSDFHKLGMEVGDMYDSLVNKIKEF